MAGSGSPSIPPVTLDQLIALNDEIAALVRVGVPLEQGLRQLAAEMPGRTGKVAALLAERLQRGEPLPQVLAEHPAVFPPVYRAMVETGLRSGRLAGALEAMAGSARRLAETRRMVARGFLYPLIVFLVAWTLFVLFTVVMAPVFLELIAEVGDRGLDARAAGGLSSGIGGWRQAVLEWASTGLLRIASGLLPWLVGWRETAAVWGTAVPAVVLLLAALWWFRSGRASLMESRAVDVFLGWLPWTGRMLRTFRTATLADLLAMLLEHSVPLDQALELAAESVGEPRMVRAAREMAEAIRRGEPLGRRARAPEFSPLLTWLIVAGSGDGSIAGTLRHASQVYHRRARYQADAAQLFLPILLTLAIGGTVTLLYALLVLGTWFSVLRTLA